jgi:diketogulonate reductase-like aldo/keto reductase
MPMQMAPRLIYGTAWKKARTAELVRTALATGFRAVDTACQPKHYDEAGVGAGLAAAYATGLRREELYLQTKFTSLSGQDRNRIPYDPNASLSDQVAQSFATSQRNLDTEYLDCLVLHSPLSRPVRTDEVWRAMEMLVDAGGAQALGISNCYELGELERIHDMARIKPAVVQNRFYAETGYDQEIRAFCRERGISYQSFWTLTANPALLGADAISRLARAHKRTPPQILFRYLSQIGVTPLTGTTSIQHMREDLAIFDFELARSEIDAISALL